MPYLNNRQFLDAGYAGPEWVGFGGNPEPSARKANYPQSQQLALPGLGQDVEQMRLFDTRRAGPANIYAMNTSPDASDWRDKDIAVPLGEEQQAIVDDDEYTVSGEFFEFPIGLDDREFMAYGSAHNQEIQRTQREGTHLGHENYPERTNPGLQFSDLLEDSDGWAEASWWTPGQTEVGRVDFHEDRWGPNVDHAEINPLYRGRGFSREAIPDFAANLEPGAGIVHAGGYTDAGRGAFHAKGIPTETDIEYGFADFVEQMDVDEDEVTDFAMDRLRSYHGDAADLDPSEWTEDMGIDYQHFRETAEESIREQAADDSYTESMYREQLEDMQEQVLANLPTSRKGAFMSGWKPEHKTGRQEELPGMPSKYTGIGSDEWRYGD